MLLLKNATVYPQTEKAPFVGDVLCENGRIKEIGKDLSADDAETIDLTGLNLSRVGWVAVQSTRVHP